MASSATIVGLNDLVANRKLIQKLRRGKGLNIEPYRTPHFIVSKDVTVSSYWI